MLFETNLCIKASYITSAILFSRINDNNDDAKVR